MHRNDVIAMEKGVKAGAADARQVNEVDITMKNRHHWPVALTVEVKPQATVEHVTRAKLGYDRSLIGDPSRDAMFKRCLAVSELR